MTQETALAILKTGKNVFLTGEPGSGKTYTVNQYVEWLESHRISPAVTASTGIAATHIGGMTIHAWSGIGIRTFLTESELTQLADTEKLRKRMTRTSVLIIDEISMLDGRTLTAVDAACRAVRRDDRPFGGLQIVFVGDFFQLPPVWRSNPTSQQTLVGSPEGPQFAFRSPAWENADPTVCYLSEQHRQEDAAFLSLLACVRRGEMTEDAEALLQTCHASSPGDAIHTRLFSHNADVDRVNNEHLLRLPGETKTFDMNSKGPERYVLSLKKSCLSPERLLLKVGARVMFTKNLPELGFVNGTLGEVTGFDAEDDAPLIKTTDGVEIRATPTEWAMMDGSRTLAKLAQLPLRLAWAITVHKSQGMTLDAAVVDLSRAFEYGQGYVALSRVRSSAGLHLLGWNERALQVHPDILASDNGFKRQSANARAEAEGRSVEAQAELEKSFILASGGKLEKERRAGRGAIHRAQDAMTGRDESRPYPAQRRAARSAQPKGPSTYEQTLALFQAGKSLAEIAEARSFSPSTIMAHLEKLAMDDAISKEELVRLIPPSLADAAPAILEAFRSAGDGRLTPIFEKFGEIYSYEDLKLVRLLM